MLVLSRRSGQKIVIGNEITIEVLAVSGEGVKLGITAPETTSVHRHEVFAEIEKANLGAGVKADDGSLEQLSAFFRSVQQK